MPPVMVGIAILLRGILPYTTISSMFAVKKTFGEKEINIVVETKDVEGKNVLRGDEGAKIKCAHVFFEILSQEGYAVHFREQINNKQMAQIINEVLHSE